MHRNADCRPERSFFSGGGVRQRGGMAVRGARAADDADDRVRQRRFIELPKRGRIV
jgi:hypothetical protein